MTIHINLYKFGEDDSIADILDELGTVCGKFCFGMKIKIYLKTYQKGSSYTTSKTLYFWDIV